ncbi:T9SS type A sorting domain-containing protein [Candidatus Woesearchaeota archaeon]|nr:T9SS type A sorting domain-containing protein [Candidatus Woesearchaeota archaeon]
MVSTLKNIIGAALITVGLATGTTAQAQTLTLNNPNVQTTTDSLMTANNFTEQNTQTLVGNGFVKDTDSTLFYKNVGVNETNMLPGNAYVAIAEDSAKISNDALAGFENNEQFKLAILPDTITTQKGLRRALHEIVFDNYTFSAVINVTDSAGNPIPVTSAKLNTGNNQLFTPEITDNNIVFNDFTKKVSSFNAELEILAENYEPIKKTISFVKGDTTFTEITNKLMETYGVNVQATSAENGNLIPFNAILLNGTDTLDHVTSEQGQANMSFTTEAGNNYDSLVLTVNGNPDSLFVGQNINFSGVANGTVGINAVLDRIREHGFTATYRYADDNQPAAYIPIKINNGNEIVQKVTDENGMITHIQEALNMPTYSFILNQNNQGIVPSTNEIVTTDNGERIDADSIFTIDRILGDYGVNFLVRSAEDSAAIPFTVQFINSTTQDVIGQYTSSVANDTVFTSFNQPENEAVDSIDFNIIGMPEENYQALVAQALVAKGDTTEVTAYLNRNRQHGFQVTYLNSATNEPITNLPVNIQDGKETIQRTTDSFGQISYSADTINVLARTFILDQQDENYEATTNELFVTDNGQAIDMDTTILVTPATGIETKLQKNNKLLPYPNPATQYVQMGLPGVYHIMNIQGQVLKQGDYQVNEQIDVTDLNKGTYIIRVQQDNESKIGKFIKE